MSHSWGNWTTSSNKASSKLSVCCYPTDVFGILEKEMVFEVVFLFKNIYIYIHVYHEMFSFLSSAIFRHTPFLDASCSPSTSVILCSLTCGPVSCTAPGWLLAHAVFCTVVILPAVASCSLLPVLQHSPGCTSDAQECELAPQPFCLALASATIPKLPENACLCMWLLSSFPSPGRNCCGT